MWDSNPETTLIFVNSKHAPERGLAANGFDVPDDMSRTLQSESASQESYKAQCHILQHQETLPHSLSADAGIVPSLDQNRFLPNPFEVGI
jgi:hypothetical protein